MRSLSYVAVDGVALTAATAKTVFEFAAGAQRVVRVAAFGICMRSVTATDGPALFEIETDDTGATTGTGTGVVETNWNYTSTGTAGVTVKHTLTVEPASFALDRTFQWRVPVNGPYTEYFPLGDELILPVSSISRFRLTAPQAQTALMWVKFAD